MAGSGDVKMVQGGTATFELDESSESKMVKFEDRAIMVKSGSSFGWRIS